MVSEIYFTFITLRSPVPVEWYQDITTWSPISCVREDMERWPRMWVSLGASDRVHHLYTLATNISWVTFTWQSQAHRFHFLIFTLNMMGLSSGSQVLHQHNWTSLLNVVTHLTFSGRNEVCPFFNSSVFGWAYFDHFWSNMGQLFACRF
jgi:hypothetical protein